MPEATFIAACPLERYVCQRYGVPERSIIHWSLVGIFEGARGLVESTMERWPEPSDEGWVEGILLLELRVPASMRSAVDRVLGTGYNLRSLGALCFCYAVSRIGR